MASSTVRDSSDSKPTTISPSPTKRLNSNENEENQWGNKFQFILSCIGLSVGLGNVWRFPGLAYENGGSAFLIPYITSGFVLSLPAMYMEFIIGQYTQVNPAKAFYLYAPAFHDSIPSKNNTDCYKENPSLPYAFNGTCIEDPPNGTSNGGQEFFNSFVTTRSSEISDFGEFNYPVALCLVILYVLCAAIHIKGIKILGKISYFTVRLPYIVVLILFVRGMLLDGAIDGVKLYLFEPDMSKLLSFKTWVAALNQTCFSLTLGLGALISLASHNKKKNNCFPDALTVIVFDTLMSVLGGLAVFSILGYLAKLTGKEITKIVDNGPSLVFIVYPEAIATMPLPWLWNLLLFGMLFFLGFSTQIGWGNLARDLENIFGPRPKSWLSLFFSRHSPYFFFCWAVVCPILAFVAFGLILNRDPMKMGNYVYPIWAEVIGWFINLGPVLAIPICLLIQCIRLKMEGISLTYLFRPAKEHLSHDRIYRKLKIDPPEGFNEGEETTTETQETLTF